MPRYFLHLFNDVTAIDSEGRDLPDHLAAMREAFESARAMAAVSVCEGKLNLGHRIEVRNATGGVVGVVHFRDVVEVSG